MALYKLREINKKKITPPVVKQKWGSFGFVYTNNEPRIMEGKNNFDTSNSNHQQEIRDYIESGGKIKTYCPDINGKIPGASMQNPIMSNWSIDDIMGFGYSNRFMEEVDIKQGDQGGFDVD